MLRNEPLKLLVLSEALTDVASQELMTIDGQRDVEQNQFRSFHMYINISIKQSINLSIYLSIHPSIHPSMINHVSGLFLFSENSIVYKI